MTTAKAARYNEILLSPTGAILPNTSVEVRLPNIATKATLYTDESKATQAANPTTTDAFGNLMFWADWDSHYDLWVNNTLIEDVALTPSHAALTGTLARLNATVPVLTPKAYGAYGDVANITATTTAGSTTVTINQTAVAADVGKTVAIRGAGTPGAGTSPDIAGDLVGVVQSVSGSSVVLSVAAGTAVTDASASWGHDDTAALNEWAAAVSTKRAVSGSYAEHIGYWSSGHYFVSGEVKFGGDTSRLDGMTLIFPGDSNVRLLWIGPTPNDGSGGGAGGTFPQANESVLHFKNLGFLKTIGGCRIEAFNGGVTYNRVGIWFDSTVNATAPDFDAFTVSSMVTGVLLGQALTYTGGTWLEPTGWTAPTAQYNAVKFGRLSTLLCIESLRMHGVNGETPKVEYFNANSVRHVVTFNGRGVQIDSGSAVQTSTPIPLPGQTPNDFIVLDIRGKAGGLSGGGPYVINNLRDEQMGRVARCRDEVDTRTIGAINLSVRGLHGAVTTGLSATRTVATAEMTAGSDLLTSSDAAFTSADRGRTVSVAGVGSGGATVNGIIRTYVSATQVRLSFQATTTASGQSLTINGYTPGSKVVQWAAEGGVSIEDSVITAPDALFTVERLSGDDDASCTLRNCSINTAAGADTAPTTLVNLASPSGAGTTRGLKVTLEGITRCDVTGAVVGQLSDRKYRVTAALAASSSYENMLRLNGPSKRVESDYAMGGAFPLKVGRWHFFPGGTNSALSLVDQRVTLVPMDISMAATLDRIGCEVTTAGAAGSVIRLGIYDDDGTNNPGALLLDAGTVDSTTTGPKSITISQSLAPGRKWLAICAQGAPSTAPAVRSTVTGNDPSVGMFNQSSAFQRALRREAVSAALPSPAAATGDTTMAPLVHVRAA